MKEILELAESIGFTKFGEILVKDITFDKVFREACEQNSCGRYGKSWTCPPHVGEYEELKAKILAYDKGVVVQTVYTIEDSFDFEGMMDGAKIHKDNFEKLFMAIKNDGILNDFYALGAGGCGVCEKCSCLDNEPCRFPDRAVSSVEAYGMNVNELVKLAGLLYNNGVNTVSYVGLIVF